MKRSLLLLTSIASSQAFLARDAVHHRVVFQASTLEEYQQTSVFAPSANMFIPEQQNQQRNNPLREFWAPVGAAALTITSNTVGAGCLVMPELAAGPGLATTATIFGAAYIVNLVSGLILAQVSITQKEQYQQEHASFQELATANLGPLAAQGISTVSILTNGCLQAFGATRAGLLAHDVLNVPAPLATVAWAAFMITTVGTLSKQNLSAAASICAAGLFCSFGGLILPGLQAVNDPIATWFAPGVATDWTASVAHAAPVMLMSMVYQNIVPTMTQVLGYDRTKTTTAIVLGSAIPLVMYLAWCYACLGGGMDATGPLLTMFSLVTLAGSGLGSSMSLAQEVRNFVQPQEQQTVTNTANQSFGLPSAAVAISVPVAVGLAMGGSDAVTDALSMAGAFGTPLLYGAIPVAMAWAQRRQATQPLVPSATLPCLGAMSLGFMGQEVLARLPAM